MVDDSYTESVIASSEYRGALIAFVGLLIATVWLFEPVLFSNGMGSDSRIIIGDPQTDAVRGAWGFDHLNTSLLMGQLPWDTSRLNFPTGVELMVLPLASGMLLSILALLDPLVAWNLSLMVLILASSTAIAWLARTMTDCWPVGMLAGLMLMGQPMIHHALADGTAEHLALWALPLLIGAAWIALSEQSPKWGVATGVLSIAVALDSPYQALYALVLGLIVLPTAVRVVNGRERDLMKSVGAMVLAGTIGVLLVFYLYGRFTAGVVEEQDTALLQRSNATDMRLWWRYMESSTTLRDPTRPPTIIPSIMIVGSLLASIMGGKKALPWVVAGLVMLGLSFGLRTETTTHLSEWLGSPAGALGSLALGINEWFYTLPIAEQLRFPRRWLVPASMALSVAAAIGLASFFQRYLREQWMQWIAVTILGATALSIGVSTSKVHNSFPMHALPDVEFATHLEEDSRDGAVMLLPVIRELPPGATRANLPVFARLGTELASADDLYLQMLHRRSMVSYPSLQTLTASAQDVDVQRIMRDWSDLSDGKSTNRGIPPSAFDPGASPERNRGLRKLRDAGLLWLVVDLGAYDNEGIDHLRTQLGSAIASETQFDEGDGILLIELLPGTSSEGNN